MNKDEFDSLYKEIRISAGSVWSNDDFRYMIALKKLYKEMFILDNINNEKDKNEKIVKPKINAKLI